MESYRLIREGGALDAEWTLEWDDVTLSLKAPDGQVALEAPATAAHRLVDLFELYGEGKISFAAPRGSLTFKKQSTAVPSLRILVDRAMAGDPEFRAELQRQSLWLVARGLAMFVVCGGLFGLYCWVASWAPDPPPGHWIRWFGGVIHWVLLVLMGFGLAGPCVAWFGLRQWLRVRRIERLPTEFPGRAEFGAAPDGSGERLQA